jgi:DNA repair protein RadC
MDELNSDSGVSMETQNTNYRIQDLEVEDRPRERLANNGAQTLSNAELIAILLRVGLPGENVVQLSQRLINTFDGLEGLFRASFIEISQIKGIGMAKAAQVMAAIELGKRFANYKAKDRPGIHSPQDAADLVKYEMNRLDHEELWVILLDTRNRLLGIEKLYKGSVNSSTVRVAEILRTAIQRNAPSLLMMHNHPSGDPTPSPEDINLTRAVLQSGKIMDIELLDHLVIAGGRFASLKEKRLGFE